MSTTDEEKNCKYKDTKHGHCLKCGLLTQPVIECKCPFRSDDWREKLKKEWIKDFGNPPLMLEELTKGMSRCALCGIKAEQVADWWLAKLENEKELSREEGRKEERQFILNVLDGIDQADREMGNKFGGTKAIRFALQSRIIN